MIIDNNDSRSQTGNHKTEAPTLIQTRQGASVLYKDKYLYSKYDPSKSILNIISNIEIPEYSIILIFSPVLWHGLKELLEKLPETSFIAAFEYDSQLYDLALKNIPEELQPFFNSKIKIYNSKNISEYYDSIQKQHYRKQLKIDFSAGSVFFKAEYDSITILTQRIIDQFWKNRLTLIKFGRLYSKNIFKNLRLLPHSIPLQKIYKTIDRPLIVLGAGESLNETIVGLKECQNSFFIIAVDAAANPLLENGIMPDAIIAVEGQQAIEKAYIGKPSDSKILLIMDLVSRNHIPYITNGKTSFFISEYASMNFMERLNGLGLLPPVIPPLGSVGLAAMEIALHLRADETIPVFFSGLDFSYSPGITHAKETPAHKNILISNSKLKSLFNFASAFGQGNFPVQSKNSTVMYSSKVLEAYGLLFTEQFSDKKNIFDLGTTGIDLKTTRTDFKTVIESIQQYPSKTGISIDNDVTIEKAVKDFLTEEKNQLEILKSLFTNGDASEHRMEQLTLKEQIDSILKCREYLYIHFPDASGPTNQQSFYNRIRIELDFFLKEIQLVLDAQF